jgi:hypothetical protein
MACRDGDGEKKGDAAGARETPPHSLARCAAISIAGVAVVVVSDHRGRLWNRRSDIAMATVTGADATGARTLLS